MHKASTLSAWYFALNPASLHAAVSVSASVAITSFSVPARATRACHAPSATRVKAGDDQACDDGNGWYSHALLLRRQDPINLVDKAHVKISMAPPTSVLAALASPPGVTLRVNCRNGKFFFLSWSLN